MILTHNNRSLSPNLANTWKCIFCYLLASLWVYFHLWCSRSTCIESRTTFFLLNFDTLKRVICVMYFAVNARKIYLVTPLLINKKCQFIFPSLVAPFHHPDKEKKSTYIDYLRYLRCIERTHFTMRSTIPNQQTNIKSFLFSSFWSVHLPDKEK